MMKIKNKRLLSGLLCIMMLLAAMPLMASAEGFNILLNGDSFDVPAYANGGYINNGGTALNSIFLKSMKIAADGNVRYSKAKIYFRETGTYNIWVLSGNENGVADRYGKVIVDSQEEQMLTAHKDHQWDKTTWTVDAGWHEISLGICNSWKNTLINAVYITDDLDYTPTVETDDELMAYYSDSAPEFASDAAPQYELSGADCVITFPQVVNYDSSNIVYSYVVEGKETVIDDITAPVTLKSFYGTKSVKLTATNYIGSFASLEFEITGAQPPETLFLRCDNISITPDLAGWQYQASAANYYSMLADGDTNLPGISTDMSTPGYDSASYATAHIIVNGRDGGAPKTYYLWAAGRSDSARPIHVAFDDNNVFSQSTVGTTIGAMAWCKFGEGFSLTPGLHTLKIKVGGNNSGNFQGMIITEDKDYTPGKGTTYADIQSIAYIDVDAPKFASSADIEVEYADGQCDITFPIADDGENNYLVYEYTVNGEKYPSDSTTITVSDVAPLQKLNIEAVAYDKLGNSAVVEKAFTASDVQVSGFEIAKDGEAVADLSALGANDVIGINAKVASMAQSTVNLEMALILYSKDYKRMVHYVPSSLSALEPDESNVPFTVSMTLPADFVNNDGSVIAAVLWDKDTGEPYAEGIELKGAE